MIRVLIAEDEPQMAGFIARGLGEQGYSVAVASDGETALKLISRHGYDLVLLDIQLPQLDGFAVCRELRARSLQVPVLMLTARAAVSDVVNGLNCGADDYLSKPFDFGVLLARLQALLRRAGQVRGNVLRVADLSLNTLDHTAERGGRQIRLTAKEYALLELFMLHPGEILGRARIAEHVWDEDFDAFSNVIDVYMNRLRRKIDQGNELRLIQTRRSEGYMLSADLSESAYV